MPLFSYHMPTIRAVYNRVASFDSNKAAEAAIIATADKFIEHSKEQLKAGYNRFDEKIGDSQPYKNADYAFEKYAQNPLPGLGNPDLDLTGSFQGGLELTVQDGIVSEKSTDAKNAKLLAQYPDIMGLGGPFKAQYVVEDLRPAFSLEVFKGIGIKPR